MKATSYTPLDTTAIDLADDDQVSFVDGIYACPECVSAHRRLAPGERAHCPTCGWELERDKPHVTPTQQPSAGLPVGRYCRDDLLWYGGARAELERLQRERLGPSQTTCALSSAITSDKRPSNLLLMLRLDTQRVSDVEARAQRIELIERTMDRVLARGPWLYRVLQQVWLVRGGRVEDTWPVYWSTLAERCATPEQLAAWSQVSTHRTLAAAWGKRTLAEAVAAYDEEHG